MYKFAIKFLGRGVQSRRFVTLEAAKEIAESDKHYIENSNLRDSSYSNYQILEFPEFPDGTREETGKIVYDSRDEE